MRVVWVIGYGCVLAPVAADCARRGRAEVFWGRFRIGPQFMRICITVPWPPLLPPWVYSASKSHWLGPTAFGNVRLAGFAPNLDLYGRLCGRATRRNFGGYVGDVTARSCDFTAHMCTGMIAYLNYTYYIVYLDYTYYINILEDAYGC